MTTNYTINALPSKKEIVKRLLEAKQIDFDEALELMKEPVQLQQVTPQQPYNPWVTLTAVQNPYYLSETKA
jgi:tRNA A37 threonylcarbamoyladenosine synthetase subunit TsaC/SUA5/YrdC